MTRVTRWHLAMDTPDALRPARPPGLPATIARVLDPTPEYARFLYTAVGWRWQWVDRLPWTWTEWQAVQARPGYELWVMQVRGGPAGYYELRRQPDGDCEILLFGLLPPFIGQGLGGHLLADAVHRAWEGSTRRVVLNTCSLDHPNALNAYLARGFRLERTEEFETAPPAPMDGPWVGAGIEGNGE